METIFIIDDDPSVLASLKRLLLDEDFSVRTFSDGHQALAALADTQVAVIV